MTDKDINSNENAVDCIKGILKDVSDDIDAKDLREERLKKYSEILRIIK